MKITCDIALDLIGLYLDGVASPDSKKAVEEHLKDCESCRKYYGTLRKQNIVQKNISSAFPSEPGDNSYKEIMIRIGKKTRNTGVFFVGAALTFAFICSLASVHFSKGH